MAPFCSCPASLVSRMFFAVGPGCAKCFFFLLRSVGRRDLSAGPEQKKKHHPGCFFFAPAPRGRSLTHCGPGWRCLPLGGVVFVFLLRGGAGPGWCFFFCCGPARTLTHSLWAGAISARPGWCFFLLRPRRVFLDNNKKCLGYYIGSKKTRRGHSKKKKTPLPRFCFLLWPRAGAQRGFSFPCRSRGRSKKKKNTLGGVFFFALAPCRLPTGLLLPLPFAGAAAKKKNTLGGVFFLLWPRAGAQRGFSFPCLSPGPEQLLLPLPFAGAAKKKNTLGGAFFFAAFFCCGPARTLTHSLRAWVAMPPPRRGGVFFCCGPARTGVVLFFCCGPARTLTHSRWAGAISARPGWCFFFLLRPRRVFLDNNKKCLGYYIGSKKTRRGHSKKKKHHFRAHGWSDQCCYRSDASLVLPVSAEKPKLLINPSKTPKPQ